MVNENILYYKGESSQNINNRINNGVLIIDPNRVIDDDGNVKDRTINHEDMVIYANLAVYKSDRTSIIHNTTNNKTDDVKTEALLNINFLNPIKGNNPDGSYIYKNKLTTEWADFFTSNDVNKNALDPETFGITNIDITINATYTPVVTIQFTDVQGRTLFNRGNDEKNPYNLFFTFPYPNFILAVKGYYGATVEYPLKLQTSNTNFDPNTGNYITTCTFIGDLFSLFNSLLLIYAYAAPYMYKKDDGNYKGMEILSALYKRQNAKILNNFNNNTDLASDYIIENTPTLYDLAEAIKRVPTNSKDGVTQNTEDLNLKNKNILNIKYRIDQFVTYISTYINRKDIFSIDSDNFYSAIENENKITETTPIELVNRIKSLNDEINKLDQSIINTFVNKLKSEINKYNTDNQIKINFSRFNRALTNKDYLNIHIFIISDNKYTLEYFNLFMNVLNGVISDEQVNIDNQHIENQITDFGNKLGWKPNLSNVIRIISNNVQTFLHLLNSASVTAQSQIKFDQNRVLNFKDIDYVENKKGIKKIRPFPNYFKRVFDPSINSEKLELQYPAIKEVNNNWVEVNFIEELYSAVQVLNQKNNPNVSQTNNTQKTGLLTTFSFGNTDLSTLNKTIKQNDYISILSELIVTTNLFVAHSGIPLHGINQNGLNSIGQTLSDYHTTILNNFIFADLDTNQRFILSNDIIKTIESIDGDNNDVLNSIARNITINNFTINPSGPSIFDGNILPLVSREIGFIKSGSTQQQYNDLNNAKLRIIDNSLTNKQLYNLINYNKSPLTFTTLDKSLTKTSKTTVNFDIGLNRNFTAVGFDTLLPMQDSIKETDSDSVDTNPIQGYIKNLNNILSLMTLNYNFNDIIKFKSDINGSPQSAQTLMLSTDFFERNTLQEPIKMYSYIFNEYI